MKVLKRVLIGIGITIVILPFLLIFLYIGFEIVGMNVNHSATDKQTKEFQQYIEATIPGAEVTDVYSETGNTTGTSNHVDCLSRISFTSSMDQADIEKLITDKYKYAVVEIEDNCYVATLVTEAPFFDNIEGH